MKTLKTEICINASKEKIWDLLMNVAAYPQWNPFIKSIEGTLAVGEKIHVLIAPPGTSSMKMNPTILNIQSGVEFRWIGHLLIPGLFDGEHIFQLIDNNDGTTTFVQMENFKGILVPLFAKMLDDNTKNGFETMNQKIKELCED
jgi:hypothetical protein